MNFDEFNRSENLLKQLKKGIEDETFFKNKDKKLILLDIEYLQTLQYNDYLKIIRGENDIENSPVKVLFKLGSIKSTLLGYSNEMRREKIDVFVELIIKYGEIYKITLG